MNVHVCFMISQENDDWLRNQNRRKGDMSRIVNKLLDEARLKSQPAQTPAVSP